MKLLKKTLAVILAGLMIFSVFSVIQVYAAYKVDSVSLSYDIDKAYLNTALKEKDVSEMLVGTSRTSKTSSPLYNYIKDQSYLCYMDSSGTFKRLDNSEDFCKSERQYYYSAKFKTTSSGTWEPEILEMKEGNINIVRFYFNAVYMCVKLVFKIGAGAFLYFSFFHL